MAAAPHSLEPTGQPEQCRPLRQPEPPRRTDRVRFVEQDDRIELVHWTREATIRDLVEGIEAFRLAGTLRTAHCAGCGECCYQRIPVFAGDLPLLARAVNAPLAGTETVQLQEAVTIGPLAEALELPPRPDSEGYERGVADLARQFDLSPADARLIYEYNNSEPIILARAEDGACRFLRDGWCTIYDYRTLIGRLYVCNMAERFAVLEEEIVVQGTWHAYARLGWVDAGLLKDNPFFQTESAWDIPLSSFRSPSPESMEKLFFYF